MLIYELWNCFCRENDGSIGTAVSSALPKQAETAAPLITPPKENSVDEEINSLARHLGGISFGQKIQLTLGELMEIVPHKRKRSDSYAGLIKKLKTDFNVSLEIIKSKKSL